MTSTLAHFHLFPVLPGELRLKIFTLALRNTRTVSVNCTKGILPTQKRYAKEFTSSHGPPPLLHVCSESRFEALSLYTPYFSTTSSPNHIYISFAFDTLRFPDSVLGYLGRSELEGIQTMILDVNDMAYFSHYNMDILRTMKSLRDLELVVESRVSCNWSNGSAGSVIMDFEEERQSDPGWNCPNVKISLKDGSETGALVGGALIPGFVDESTEPRPHPVLGFDFEI